MFIMPPSLNVLKQRLEARGTDSKESIEKRLAAAQKEVDLALQLRIFHRIIKNDNLEIFLKQSTEQIIKWYPILNTNSSK
jgi:guanylate kinase